MTLFCDKPYYRFSTISHNSKSRQTGLRRGHRVVPHVNSTFIVIPESAADPHTIGLMLYSCVSLHRIKATCNLWFLEEVKGIFWNSFCSRPQLWADVWHRVRVKWRVWWVTEIFSAVEKRREMVKLTLSGDDAARQKGLFYETWTCLTLRCCFVLYISLP